MDRDAIIAFLEGVAEMPTWMPEEKAAFLEAAEMLKEDAEHE